MATLLLQAVGGMLGGVLGPVGSAVGAAAGAMAGYLLDTALINSTRHIEGARLAGSPAMSAEEGAPVPRAFGQVRLPGTVIWATRFEEDKRTERQGGKGGPTVTSYSYHANLALGLCEGQIAAIRRVWADGREVDLRDVTWRLYTGTEDQEPDPLIEAKQGAGNAPAYRGLAYLVFERFPLADYGNRIPQFQIEVINPIGQLERDIRAVAIIPGSTEHGLSPHTITAKTPNGETVEVNRHVMNGETDWQASIDELQAVCPNLKHVSLVVSWFCDDLRAGAATIRPAVVRRDGASESAKWSVGGLNRSSADVRVVSLHDGRPAYGGTPSDASIIAAISDLKARGLAVTLCPFVLMDIPEGNGRESPYADSDQPAYPWRGRITCHPAPGRPQTADKTAAAEGQLASFVGTAAPADFAFSNGSVSVGEGADFGFRRFVLHHAALAAAAGGVDAFVLSSELTGLTRVRGTGNAFPFVDALSQLATDVRSMLGPSTKITYGADWSEYFGYHPQDGSGEVWFNLDPLWAHPDIDAVGIDNYMPLGDARPFGTTRGDDRGALVDAVQSGEGFDWYYALPADRENGVRSAITDGLSGKDWVYRYKDLKGWWSNQHFNRAAGAESATPTAWIPMSKPIWFTELGCPAVRSGSNQPNVFPDAKSSEGALPHFSDGTRDDATQRAFLEAHFLVWNDTARNPVSPIYGGPMVDSDRIYAWAWDARPFPAFPLFADVWGDGNNWLTGHWLNGRLGGVPLREYARIVAGPDIKIDSAVAGVVDGILIGRPARIRDMLEPMLRAFGLIANTNASSAPLVIGRPETSDPIMVADSETVEADDGGTIRFMQSAEHDLPREVMVTHRDLLQEFRVGTVNSQRLPGSDLRRAAFELPMMCDSATAAMAANRALSEAWSGRSSATVQLPLKHVRIEPGDRISLSGTEWLVERVAHTHLVEIEARAYRDFSPPAFKPSLPGQTLSAASAGQFGSAPLVLAADLPRLSASIDTPKLHLAIHASPDRPQAVLVSLQDDGFEQRMTTSANATTGILLSSLGTGVSGRVDHASAITVLLRAGSMSSAPMRHVLSGRNLLAVQAANGVWELVQFLDAEETEPGQFRLTRLLRGLGGTEDAMEAGAVAGAPLFVLDANIAVLDLADAEVGMPINLRIGAPGKPIGDRHFTTIEATGGLRARLPLAPVHLRARRTPSGQTELSWIRRSRIDAGTWLDGEVPLDEATEVYSVTIHGEGGGVTRLETDRSSIALPVDMVPPTAQSVDVSVSQKSQALGDGIATRRTLDIQP